MTASPSAHNGAATPRVNGWPLPIHGWLLLQVRAPPMEIRDGVYVHRRGFRVLRAPLCAATVRASDRLCCFFIVIAVQWCKPTVLCVCTIHTRLHDLCEVSLDFAPEVVEC